MPFRRYARRSFARRRKAKFLWVRSNENNVSPVQGPTPNQQDLMATFRTLQGGLLLELPDLVVWRIHIKISIRFRFTSTSYSSNAGVFCGIFVDSKTQLTTNPFGAYQNQYAFRPLMWDFLYAAKSLQESAVDFTVSTTTDNVLYQEYDIKSHRRFANVDDTLWLQLTGQGAIAIQDYSFVQSTLIRVPG